MKTNVLIIQLLDGTYILLHTYRYLLLFLRLQVLDNESMLIDMSFSVLHMSFLYYGVETLPGCPFCTLS